jgi:hypothetical protein
MSIADHYESAPNACTDQHTLGCYEAFASETLAQFRMLVAAG